MNNYSKAVFYFIGNFGSKFLSSLLVPIYAIYLTSQDLGEYDFQLSIAQFLAPILLCAIWESVLKFSLSGKDYYICIIQYPIINNRNNCNSQYLCSIVLV